MGDLSYVGETGRGCLIYRETNGRYLVDHQGHPHRRTHAATLAGAYAACQLIEMELEHTQARA
ncbi:MAG: hypothetical protein VKL97_06430 [Cyanobacteriota bacterium]|nr:hypothetical protein [Cyanobacteriota bacterium]